MHIIEIHRKTTQSASFPASTSHTPQDCKKLKYITEIAGKSLVGMAALGVTCFFTAPVTVPLAAATAAGLPTFVSAYCVQTHNELNQPSTTACVNGLFVAFVASGIIGGVTGYYTWNPIVNYVYTSQAACLAGLSGLGMMALGGTLWRASRSL